MRGERSASDSTLGLARGLTIALALALLGCPYAATRPVPERRAPARVLVVRLEQVSLRASAWVELHSWLGASARASSELGDPALDAAAQAYAVALVGDDRDERLARTMRALATCDDEPCARAAVRGSPFAEAYLAALPDFLARHWLDRAEVARAGIELARASMSDEVVEALVARLARDLAIEWPAAPQVQVVGNAPEPGREALVRPVLAARGSCFARAREDTERMRDARVVDCVLAYAALELDARSALAVALGQELHARGRSSELARAWTALVVHAVSVTVAAWEPKHASVLRRSAVAVMPRTMEWLAREWPARMHGESVNELARRYAEALDER